MSQVLTTEQWQVKKLIRGTGREWWMMSYRLEIACFGFMALILIAVAFSWFWSEPRIWPWLTTAFESILGLLAVFNLAFLIGGIYSAIVHHNNAKHNCEILFNTVRKIIVLEADNWPVKGTFVYPRFGKPNHFRLDWLPDRRRNRLGDAIISLRPNDYHRIYRNI